MSAKKSYVEIVEEVLQNNYNLLSLLNEMTLEDKIIYLPKVMAMIDKTKEIISPAISERNGFGALVD